MRNYDKLQVFLDEVEKGTITYSEGSLYYRGNKVKGAKYGKGGYLAMDLGRDGVRYRCLVHLIVFAMHHGIEELKKHETIDHINGDKYDNHIENLQGLSRFENSQKDSNGKLTVEDAKGIKEKLALGATTTGLSKEYGVSSTTISKIKRGLRFKYV